MTNRKGIEMLRFIIAFALCSLVLVSESRLAAQDKPSVDTSNAEKFISSPTTLKFLLDNFEVRKDLELAGDQVKTIQEQLEISQRKLEDYRKELRELGREVDQEKVFKLREECLESLQENADTIEKALFPHQRVRLLQHAVQFGYLTGKHGDGIPEGRVFLAPKLLSELKISLEQKKKIEALYDKRDEEMIRRYKEFREKFKKTESKAYERLLSVMSEDQKAEAEEHIGPPANVSTTPAQIAAQIDKEIWNKK